MKTYLLFVAIIMAVIFSGGCTGKNSFDLKITVVPLDNNSVATIGDLNKTADVIKNRLSYFFSIPPEYIQPEVSKNQISFTIANSDTSSIEAIKNVITANSQLEFWETYENSEITEYLTRVNKLLMDIQTADGKESKNENPLFGLLKPMISDQGQPLPSCMIGLANANDTSVINKYLKLEQVEEIFPPDIKFLWSAKPYRYDPSKSLIGLHAIKVTTGNGHAPLDGSSIISAKPVAGSDNSGVKIDLKMDSAGTVNWARITRENINHCIAVVYNGYVRSYPRVMCEISGGSTEITGDFTVGEANDLVNILRSGTLPFELKIISEQISVRK